MSKISDALRKAGQGRGTPHEEPEEPTQGPEGMAHAEPDERVDTPSPGPQPVAPTPLPQRPLSRQPGLPPLEEAFARELSALRASIEQILPDHPQRTVLVAGAIPGEGSSTISARFAQLLAHDPRIRVGLVDADFRNADPRPIPLADPQRGFASVLDGSLPAARAFRATGVEALDVLPSEGVAPDPYVLTTANHMAPFIDYLRGQYHYAILDAAPVLSAPETAVMSQLVDGVVLVIRAGRTKREVVQRAIERLQDRGATVLGVVMNRQQYVIPEFIYRRL